MLETRKGNMAFPIVANIRKGAEKTQNRPGQDLNEKFRVVFEPGMETFEQKFKSIYGSLYPEVINAMIPFDLDACFEISNEAYKAGMLVFKAVNGKILVWRDPTDGTYKVRNGEAQEPGVSLDYDPYEMSSINYKNYQGKAISLPIKTQTRLKLMIPEMEDFVWFQLKSNSFYDSLNVANNLEAIKAIAYSATGGRVAGMRINVFRAQQEILWNSDSGPKRIKKWLIQIKIDPEWVKKMTVMMASNTLSAGTEVMQLEAPNHAPDPEQDQDTSDSEPEDGVIDGVVHDVTDQPEDRQDPAEAVAEASVKATRPYSPTILKIRLAERTKHHKETDAAEEDIAYCRKIIVILLNEFYTGDDDKRHMAQEFLFGAKSLNDASDAQILAAWDWMGPEQNPETNEYFMADVARKELGQVYDEALKIQGQQALF